MERRKALSYQLQNLKGVKRKYTQATVIKKGKEIIPILTKKMACTAAGSNGALNIWITDKSELCGEFMQFCISINKETFSNVKDAVKWFSIWSEKLN